METLVALVDLHVRVDDWPFSIVEGSAEMVTVGASALGGAVAEVAESPAPSSYNRLLTSTG